MKSLESPNYCGFSPRDLDCYTILEKFEKNSIVYHKPAMKGLFRYINSSSLSRAVICAKRVQQFSTLHNSC